MKKVAIIGCGAYMEAGYGCSGEWRCLKAAALGEGNFEEPSSVVAFHKCECPGRTAVPNTGVAIKMSGIKPDKVYLSSCLVNAKPDCPYRTVDELEAMLKEKFDVEVVRGTHDYH